MYFKKATSGRTDIIWYIAGVVAIMASYVIGTLPIILAQYYQMSVDNTIGTAEAELFKETMDFSLINLSKNSGFLLMISVFIIAMLVLMLVIKYIHIRPFKNLITPKRNIDYKKIFFGFGFWIVLGIIFEGIIFYAYPETYELNFKPVSWLILVLICIFLLPIQSSFEELFVRGYLMPAISLITKNKWLPLVMTSVIFGLIHFDNPEVDKFGFWTMQLYYVGAGLFLGLITILDDSLELALGVHAATNIYGAALVAMDGSVIQTDSIFKSYPTTPYLMMAAFFISAIIFIFVCNKKYKWNGLERLFQPIGEDTTENITDIGSNKTIDANA